MDENEETADADATPQDDVWRFAADLRTLRLDAGNPTLAHLRDQTHISRTVLSDAFKGVQLPSARTVDGIVRACGGDPAPWIARRDALAAARVPVTTGDAGSVEPGSSPGAVAVAVEKSPRRTVGLGRVAALMAGAFILGAAASGVVTSAIAGSAPAAAPSATVATVGPQIIVENGSDPGQTPCADDARVATGDTRADNSLLEIRWSDKCQAGWGRITRYDAKQQGNTVTIALYPETAPDGPLREEVTEHDVQSAYTMLIVRPSPDTLLCADGSFTVDGKRIDLGDPLCI